MIKHMACVPNFSIGNDSTAVRALVAAANRQIGVTVMHHSSDPDHNRCVIALLGAPDAIENAAVNLCATASGMIDLTAHQGAHPRMGATDVIPFVPVRNVTMEECVQTSKSVGAKIWATSKIPVILYESSATADHRRNLADVRRGGFEGMGEKLQDPRWSPDFGDPCPHPTAGVTAVGARGPLIAFNVNLATEDITVATTIAKTIRASSGGYPGCKAIGIALPSQGCVQVSMNLVDYTQAPMWQVFQAISEQAKNHGVAVIESELIGIVPAAALFDTAAHHLKLNTMFDPKVQVVEQHVWE